jgi:hypothetical protein
MSTAILTGAKIAPKTAFDAWGCGSTLKNALRAAQDANLTILQRDLYAERARRLLLERASDLVKHFNRLVGMDALYLLACPTMWVLYGRADEDDADKCLLRGARELPVLMRLVERLEKGLRDVASEKERVCV